MQARSKNQGTVRVIGVVGAGVVSVLIAASGATANPVTTATSLFYYKPWATATCQSGINNLDFEPATLNWRDGMSANGATLSSHDATIFWSELTDAEAFAGGEDDINSNLDTMDAGFLGTHGIGQRTPASCYNGPAGESLNCDYTSWEAQLTTSSSNPIGNCRARTTQMELGDNQMEYLAVWACESAEKRGADYITFASYRLHQWHGFSGIMAEGDGTSNTTDDYVDDAFDGPAAVAWISNQTSWDHWGGSSDACALAIARGNNGSDAAARRDAERFGSGSYTDPTGNGWAYTYYSDCDPPSPLPGPMSGWPGPS